ncbi:MAG: Unknown protein [uncultured Thiotrichaceae bacterium]|uniref:Uncharacterized protein n=1 Tax=uncultured Thiotrichaceae bacterium TaxID=298394 RepID=A0A6S6TBU2_9GAMM|nr:MAG: Unknown protein [uncultured Thiotrichaceae bacterium]
MKKSQILATAAVANILVLGAALTTTAFAVPEQPKNWEKCAGVSKAGKNDCGSLTKGGHACAGQAESDNLDTEWIYVPEGTCAKLTGGITGKVKPAK